MYTECKEVKASLNQELQMIVETSEKEMVVNTEDNATPSHSTQKPEILSIPPVTEEKDPTNKADSAVINVVTPMDVTDAPAGDAIKKRKAVTPTSTVPKKAKLAAKDEKPVQSKGIMHFFSKTAEKKNET
jgi:hypothetical protein